MRKMKWALGIVLAIVSNIALAQSNTILYGSFDAGIRYDNKPAATTIIPLSFTTRHRQSTISSNLDNSYWGLYGMEDLGSNLKTHFVLEGDLSINAVSANSPIPFNRITTVGIEGAFGQLDMGRDYNMIFKGLATVDPLRFRAISHNPNRLLAPQNSALANYSPTFHTKSAMHANNSVQYTGVFSDTTIGLHYGLSEATRSAASIPTFSIRLGQNLGPLTFMGAYLDTEETAAWAFGSAYQIGSARLAATYAAFRLDSTHFRRYVIGIGGSYQFTPKLEFSLAHYNTQIEDVAFILGSKVYASKDIGNKDGGQSDQLVGLVEYDLSKRTALYGVINHAILKGAITPAFTGMTTQTSIALGVRHLF